MMFIELTILNKDGSFRPRLINLSLIKDIYFDEEIGLTCLFSEDNNYINKVKETPAVIMAHIDAKIAHYEMIKKNCDKRLGDVY